MTNPQKFAAHVWQQSNGNTCLTIGPIRLFIPSPKELLFSTKEVPHSQWSMLYAFVNQPIRWRSFCQLEACVHKSIFSLFDFDFIYCKTNYIFCENISSRVSSKNSKTTHRQNSSCPRTNAHSTRMVGDTANLKSVLERWMMQLSIGMLGFLLG